MRMQTEIEMQERVRLEGVINGFCYSHLRLLVNTAREMDDHGQLLNSDMTKPDSDQYHLTRDGEVVLSHIADQVQGGWDSSNWEKDRKMEYKKVIDLLEAAEFLLGIYERKPK